MSNIITTEILDGTTYYSTVYRGTSYTAFCDAWGWTVMTRRLSLSDSFGARHYRSLDELAAKCRALAALPALLDDSQELAA